MGRPFLFFAISRHIIGTGFRPRLLGEYLMQKEIIDSGVLLDDQGKLAQVGWARHQNLDCNLENVNFYQLKFLQRFRVKRWD